MVTVPSFSGLTKAYRSVLSATGSWEIAGASRCDDISSPRGSWSAQRCATWRSPSLRGPHELLGQVDVDVADCLVADEDGNFPRLCIVDVGDDPRSLQRG